MLQVKCAAAAFSNGAIPRKKKKENIDCCGSSISFIIFPHLFESVGSQFLGAVYHATSPLPYICRDTFFCLWCNEQTERRKRAKARYSRENLALYSKEYTLLSVILPLILAFQMKFTP